MTWIDNDFDYNDQLARKYMKYKGEYYDVGTVVKIKAPQGVATATFVGWKYKNEGCFVPDSGNYFDLYYKYSFSAVNMYVVEVVKPVYPKLVTTTVQKTDRRTPDSWDVEIAWIWYIVIMVVAVIFKDRWLIWGFVSIVFFLWKGGFLNGGKK